MDKFDKFRLPRSNQNFQHNHNNNTKIPRVMSGDSKLLTNKIRLREYRQRMNCDPPNLFHNHHNKCRCCFQKFGETGPKTKIRIMKTEQNLFEKLTGVKLRMDSNLSNYLCTKCDAKLQRFSNFRGSNQNFQIDDPVGHKNRIEFKEKASKMQKKYYHFIGKYDDGVGEHGVSDQLNIESFVVTQQKSIQAVGKVSGGLKQLNRVNTIHNLSQMTADSSDSFASFEVPNQTIVERIRGGVVVIETNRTKSTTTDELKLSNSGIRTENKSQQQHPEHIRRSFNLKKRDVISLQSPSTTHRINTSALGAPNDLRLDNERFSTIDSSNLEIGKNHAQRTIKRVQKELDAFPDLGSFDEISNSSAIGRNQISHDQNDLRNKDGENLRVSYNPEFSSSSGQDLSAYYMQSIHEVIFFVSFA